MFDQNFSFLRRYDKRHVQVVVGCCLNPLCIDQDMYVVTFATRLLLPGPSVSFPKPRMYVGLLVLGWQGGLGGGGRERGLSETIPQ